MPPQTGSNRPPGRSVLSADLRIVGDLTAEGTVEILGEVEGSVRAKALVVAQEGRLSGTVTADTVEIRGRMQGSVACTSLSLRSSADVTSEVVYQTLAIESGATVEGAFRRPKT
ncbi:MAG TPA: polymer-forming cytoskeletal protein [Paracoccaceae bacterium]|nr:polymer-forming cytoskeletal protein [Paracoccaceae bacterium]